MLPIKITPDPLFSSTVEIRFKSNKSLNEIFIILFTEFSNVLPKFKNIGFPPELREKNIELKYFPDYVFSNEDYSMSFNENFISFENVSDYKLWKNYSVFLNEAFTKINQLNFIDKIERIGVRYGSIFEDIKNIENILKYKPALNVSDLEEDFIYYMTKLINGENNLILQIKKDFEVKNSKNERKGHLIDIDAFFDKDFENVSVFDKINELHTAIKELFFGLLSEDFVKSLNPEYK